MFRLLEGTTKQFADKFKEIEKSVKKINAEKEAGSGLSAAQKKELDNFMDISKTHMERAEKQFERDSKALNSQRDQIRTLQVQVEALSKTLDETKENHSNRITYNVEQLDQIRFSITQLQSLNCRLDTVESRCQDLKVICQQIKDDIPPSAEHMAADVKDLQAQLSKFKVDHANELTELKGSIKR